MEAASAEALTRALGTLKAGRVVAAATESSFGLLADAENPRALDTLLSLKPRGADKGQPLVVPDLASFRQLVGTLPAVAELLAQRFWPGPLTLVVEARAGLDPRVSLAGTVAVRVPGASPAAELCRAWGRPLTATSANPPGMAPALQATEVAEFFPEAVQDGDLALLGERAPGGAPSTLVRIDTGGWSVLREGAISAAAVSEALK